MSATNVEEIALLDARLGAGAPATLHAALSTSTPTDAGGGITEPSGGAYSRVSITNNATNFPAATTNGAGKGQKVNGTAIAFPQASASWGTISHLVLFDAATGGTARWVATLGTEGAPVTVAIASGDTLTIPAGQLVITMD